jgi:hypothetical protein
MLAQGEMPKIDEIRETLGFGLDGVWNPLKNLAVA